MKIPARRLVIERGLLIIIQTKSGVQGGLRISMNIKIFLEHRTKFRHFAHTFKTNHYGYNSPEEIYRFAALEGQGSKYWTRCVKNFWALTYWRDIMYDLESLYLEPLTALKDSVRETIYQIFEYLDNPQSEDLCEYSRYSPQEGMTHSRFEPRETLVR